MLGMLDNFLLGKPIKDHEHCYHASTRPIMMLIPDGHTVQKCCECPATRTVHVDHVGTMHLRERKTC